MADSLRDGAPRPPSYMILIILTRIAGSMVGSNSSVEGKPDQVVADVAGPRRDQALEFLPVVGEQGAARLLEMRKGAGHRRHEMIGRVARGAAAIALAVGPPRRVYQPAQHDGRSAGLRVEPFPVPRQQRHLARDHAEFRPPAPARRDRL